MLEFTLILNSISRKMACPDSVPSWNQMCFTSNTLVCSTIDSETLGSVATERP